jgi:hypothetical protein
MTPPDTDGSYLSAIADLSAQGASGSGYLERLTVKVADGAAPGGYALTLRNAAHNDKQNASHAPDALFGGRIAVGVTCESLGTPTPPPSNKQGTWTAAAPSTRSMPEGAALRRRPQRGPDRAVRRHRHRRTAQGDVDCGGAVARSMP